VSVIHDKKNIKLIILFQRIIRIIIMLFKKDLHDQIRISDYQNKIHLHLKQR
jgi:hypothetical protein